MPIDSKSVLEQRLADLEASVRRRQKDWLTARAAAAAEPQDNLADIISRERTARLVLEQELAARRAQYERDIARANAVRAMVDEQLRAAALEVERARHAETSAAAVVERLARAEADAVARLAEREAEFATELSAVTETRNGLEQQLSYVESALSSARQRHELAVKEVEQLTQREAELSAQYADEAAARAALEHRIAEVEAALAKVSERASRDRTVAAERQAAYQTYIEQEIAKRRSAEDTLASARTSHASAEGQHKSAMAAAAAALAQRETEIASMRVEAATIRNALERRITDARAALGDAELQHRSAMATAATRLAEREAQLQIELASITGTRDSLEQQLREVEAALAQETEARIALERAIADARSAAADAERRFGDEIAAITESAHADRTHWEDQLSRERHDHEAELTDERQQHRSAMATAATRLAEREAQLQAELASIATAQASLEQQLRGVEATLAQETDARTTVERAITEARRAAVEAERRYRDEIATITATASAEQARLEDQIARERALAADRLTARGVEFEAELQRLSGIHASALARFQRTVAERDSRIEEQGRASAALQTRLDASEVENRRQFEQTPVPLIRCARDGALASANVAFAALVGCRTPGELRDRDFAATLFESRDDLVWLIERSMNSAVTESVETTCIRKDGARVAVRLSARPSVSGVVEIAAEDLTGVRVLEDRLREAHRMEAVGRVASEIAMTCEKLLRDVYRETQRLLTTMTGGDGQQDRAGTLLDDVTLAGSILHQLVAYGDEQTASLAPVDVNRILHDLQPVLKQVAGDAITLELRKTSSSVHVDVNAERVERLLVNVASYGRQRMPHGGRLRIELSTVVVDGKFISQHPNVRQGPHALITVTEVARPAAEGEASERTDATESHVASGRPGVDLRALQELISECGGHLWITAEPGGSMVVKMRLPLRAAWQRQADANARHGLRRLTARLFNR